MGMAMLWARRAPMYRGFGPRMLGRTLGSGMQTTIRTKSGGRVVVNPECLDIYTDCVVRGGQWEPLIHDVCKAMTNPGEVFYDIGANVGVLCVDVAAHFQGKVRVVAFEPIVPLAERIALSASLSGLENALTVISCMLGETRGEATLYLPAKWTMASAVPRGPKTTATRHPIVTLDELVESGVIPAPDTIKIDIEGAELGAFKGALRTLRAKKPTIVFEADSNMTRFGYGRRDLLAVLSSAAPYRYFYVNESGLTPADDLDAPLDGEFSNMMAIVPERPLPKFH